MTVTQTKLQNLAITESSGVCRSLRFPGVLYTNNDSGSVPAFFAFDKTGADLATFKLGIKGVDCEDCSSAIVNGVPTLILADVGDNNVVRTSYNIYVVTEPETLTSGPLTAKVITFRYPDGKKRNCESCALLPDGSIILVTKNYPALSGPTTVFTVRSWLSGDANVTVTAGPVVNAAYKTITSMDVRDDLMVIMGNGRATIFPVNDWVHASRSITMPKCNQPEAICFSDDGLSLWMTSETDKSPGAQTPLFNITL